MISVVLSSALKQLAMLRSGDLSIVELAELHLQQIARLDEKIGAFVDFDHERVRAQAILLEREWISNRDSTGPLHGLPVSIKSSIATAGYRCEIGSTLLRGQTPVEDAEVVSRLRRAGALILGTTNCPEFLMAYETENLLHGRTSNPWDLARTPGGSSGGESAAIASGMSAAGLGSDSGGSVRLPAHFTGICSLKPTPGRIPGRGHLPPCYGPFNVLGSIGPMARTIDDVWLIFETLSGRDVSDPVSYPSKNQRPTENELRRRKIGYFEDDGLVPVTEETRIAIRDAAHVLKEAGFLVEPFRPKSLEALRHLWWKGFVQCGAMLYEPMIRGKHSELSPIFQEFMEIAGQSGELDALEILHLWTDMDVERGRMLEEMQQYSVLLCPVASIPAFRHGARSWEVDGIKLSYLDAVRHTQWWNVLGAPAAVIPMGRSSDGLPIGVQVVARPHEDEIALGVAAILDRECGFVPPPIALS